VKVAPLLARIVDVLFVAQLERLLGRRLVPVQPADRRRGKEIIFCPIAWKRTDDCAAMCPDQGG